MKILINLQTGLVSNSGMQADKVAFNPNRYGSVTETPNLDELEDHENKMIEQANADLKKKLAKELNTKDEDDKKKSDTDDEDEDTGFGDLDNEDEDEDNELDLDLDDEGLEDEDEEV